MCGIAGLIHRDGAADLGQEMTAMLQSLKHRGRIPPASPSMASNAPTEYVMRLKLAEQEDSPRTAASATRSPSARRRSTGCLPSSAPRRSMSPGRPAMPPLRLRYAGDTRRLAEDIEQIEGAEVLSFGSRSS